MAEAPGMLEFPASLVAVTLALRAPASYFEFKLCLESSVGLISVVRRWQQSGSAVFRIYSKSDAAPCHTLSCELAA